jgi:hypothetical protein
MSFKVIRKLSTALVLVLALAAAVSIIYGIYHFPDAPIRKCGENCFRNKQGQPKSGGDYAHFRRWLVVTPSLVVLAIGSGLLLTSIERIKDRNPKRDDA